MKGIKEYNQKYGHVPRDFWERVSGLIDELKEDDYVSLKKTIRGLLEREYTDFTIIFYFLPKATPRTRYSGITRVFYVKDAMNYNKIFGEFVNSCEDLKDIIVTPCEFYTRTYAPTPEAMNKLEKVLAELELLHQLSKPDWDNLGKTYSDMVQKHLLLDDSLIYKGTVEKLYSLCPRVEINFKVMKKHDCKYNKKKIEKWKYCDESDPRITPKDYID